MGQPYKVIMKKELITLMLLIMTSLAYSQTISYEYDSAGNRIARTVVTLKSAETVSSEEEEEPIVDSWEEREVTIYPNPTDGELNVAITGGELEEAYSYSIYNSQGSLLLNGSISELGLTTLSLSNQSAGVYILVLSCQDESKTYKIVKK